MDMLDLDLRLVMPAFCNFRYKMSVQTHADECVDNLSNTVSLHCQSTHANALLFLMNLLQGEVALTLKLVIPKGHKSPTQCLA